MDELIDILTPEGKSTGKTALKSEAHKNGWFHATAHIWFFTSDKKILLQKKSAYKKKCFQEFGDCFKIGST